MPGPLILRANASEDIGSGHVVRLIALAQAARTKGQEALFLVGGHPEAACAQVRAAGFEATPSFSAIGGDADLAALLAFVDTHKPCAVVVDGYGFGERYLARVAEQSPTAVLDDMADRHLDVQVVVNPNYGAEKLVYSTGVSTRVLAGSQFALLRAEFVSHGRMSPVADAPPKLVLTFGASDPTNASTRLVTALTRCNAELDIRIVVGDSFGARPELENAVDRSHLRIEVIENPDSMAQCLAWGNMAITAAGGTLWELSFLGLAVAAFSVVDNQDATARSLSERRMVLGGQRLQKLSDWELDRVLEEFLGNADRRSEYASRFCPLIDGLGAERVLTEIGRI